MRELIIRNLVRDYRGSLGSGSSVSSRWPSESKFSVQISEKILQFEEIWDNQSEETLDHIFENGDVASKVWDKMNQEYGIKRATGGIRSQLFQWWIHGPRQIQLQTSLSHLYCVGVCGCT